jgi:hypothetical protein
LEELNSIVKLKEDLARNMSFSIYEYIKKVNINENFDVFYAKKQAIEYAHQLITKQISINNVISDIERDKKADTYNKPHEGR